MPIALVLACAGSDAAGTAAGVEAVRLQHTEVWSKGDVGLIPRLYSEQYVGHFPGARTVTGHAGIRASVEHHRSAFPDWTETVEQVVADGDRIVTVYRSTGTHAGTFLGNPATGNRISILETSVYRIVDGRIAEQWAFPDALSLQRQTAADQAPRADPLADPRDAPAPPARGVRAKGTLTPTGAPTEPPARIDAGGSCVVDLDRRYELSGTLSGQARMDFRILVAGPCGSPPGTFDEEWIARGTFAGRLGGAAASGGFSYRAWVRAGGDVQGRIVLGEGLVGDLIVRGNFGDGRLSYEGWVDRRR